MNGSRHVPVKITYEELTSTDDMYAFAKDHLEALGGRLFMDGDTDKADRCKRALQELRGITPGPRNKPAKEKEF